MQDDVYVFNEFKNNKIRLWLNSYEAIHFDVIDSFEHTIKPSKPIILNSNISIVVELLKHKNASNYALLGATFVPSDEGVLRVKGLVGKDKGEALLDNIAFSNDEVHVGIPLEYSQAILNTTLRHGYESNSLPTGKLFFNIGAHAAAGSSRASFANATRLIYRLLIEDIARLNSDDLKAILQDHLLT